MPRNRKTLKSWASGPTRREITRRAASDLERGLKNTDCRQPDKTSQADCARPSRRKR
jgi:hypothetical protein